jgi:aminoglycoside phosphotransferase (APT) family kinase protein
VEWFERELAAYRALARTQLDVMPRLLGCWQDPGIYPFPFAAVTRLRGEVPAEPGALIGQLGEVIACWHELEPPALAGARPPHHHDAAHHRWLRRALDRATSAGAAAEAADRLGRPGRSAAWAELLASAAQLAPVLVHGDIHQGQLLADGGRLTRHPRLGDGPGRPPVLGFRPWPVGYRDVAPPRLQRPVGAGVARVCPGAGAGRRSLVRAECR